MELSPVEKEIFPFILTQKQATSSGQEQQQLKEISNETRFTAKIAGKIAQGCHNIFYREFKEKRIPDDACFFAFEKGLEVEGEKPDYVLTLGQKQGKMKVPLMIFHEQSDETKQLSTYAKKILEDEFYINEKAYEFEHVYIVLLFPKTNEYRFVKYKRPGEDQTLADLVRYTGQCPLFDKEKKSIHDFFRLLLGCVFDQLKILHLFEEKSLQEECDHEKKINKLSKNKGSLKTKK